MKEAIDDFERFSRRKAWERAFKALYTIPEAQALRFVDGDNGFVITVARKRRNLLTALPTDGQAAYRLFYDAEAKKLLDEAAGPAEVANLERIYSAYFPTTVGDNAADRLGDFYYEEGRFDRAADCWLSVIREHPDTDLAPGLIAVKAAMALFHAGRKAEFEQVRAGLVERYRDERVTLGGETASPAELLNRLMSSDHWETKAAMGAATPAPDEDSSPPLAEVVDPAWQMRYADSVEAGMTPAELTQWRSNSLSAVVPAAAALGSSLFINYLGYIFALDLNTGKMLWRSASFHHIEILAQQNIGRMLDPARFAITALGDHVWTLSRDVKDQNMFAPFQLNCRRADNGEMVWKSPDLSEYAQFDLVGQPLLADGKLFLAAKSQANPPQQRQGLPQQYVLAIRPHDGKILWKTEVGTFRQGQQMYYYYMPDNTPQPRLVYRAGAIYLETHVGVLARLDAESGTLDWGYAYKTDAASSGNRFFYYMPQEPQATGEKPLQSGEALLIKGAQSERLAAVEPNQMKILWDRPITKASRLLGADSRMLYLGGDELSAIDLKTRKLVWATRLPGSSMSGRVLVGRDSLWQLTPRGIYEIDLQTGNVRRIFRGNDLGSAGGDLVLTDRWLLAVSNRTISAYPRRGQATRLSTRGADSATSEQGAGSP